MTTADKSPSRVAHRIENGIIASGWPVGETLGSEAELMERYSVGRGVLREAVRLLEHKQVAAMRPGPSGGLIVGAPAPSAVAETIANYFALSEITLEEVCTARRYIEADCLRLAADRLTERSIDRLRTAAVESNVNDFHHTIAEHSRNPALSIVVHGLVRASRIPVPDGAKPKHLVERHQLLVELLLSGDQAGAERLLGDDLADAREQCASDGVPDPRAYERRKLSEQLAYRIVRDLRQAGYSPGEVIGSEQQFIDRYEISRSVFRQAIQILGYYDMLEMRQGAGGGVVVGAGDPRRVVDAAVTYLDFIAIAPSDLSEARRVLELSALTELMSTPSPVECQRLRDEFVESLDVERAVVYKRGPSFHLALTELCGNRPIHFFATVLARLQTSRVGGRERTPSERNRIGNSIVDAHGRLVEAIASGDLGLARHRLNKHLAAMTQNMADRRVIPPDDTVQ